MTNDSYLRYVLSLFFVFFLLEFVITIIQAVFGRRTSSTGDKIGNTAVQIIEIISALVSIVLAEYMYVNRSAGVSSVILGCVIFCTVRAAAKSKILASFLASLVRPLSHFSNILAFCKRKSDKM